MQPLIAVILINPIAINNKFSPFISPMNRSVKFIEFISIPFPPKKNIIISYIVVEYILCLIRLLLQLLSVEYIY